MSGGDLAAVRYARFALAAAFLSAVGHRTGSHPSPRPGSSQLLPAPHGAALHR